MTDPQQRIVFCNDRYLEIYGLARSDVPRTMTGPELLSCGSNAASSTSALKSSTKSPAPRKASLPN